MGACSCFCSCRRRMPSPLLSSSLWWPFNRRYLKTHRWAGADITADVCACPPPCLPPSTRSRVYRTFGVHTVAYGHQLVVSNEAKSNRALNTVNWFVTNNMCCSLLFLLIVVTLLSQVQCCTIITYDLKLTYNLIVVSSVCLHCCTLITYNVKLNYGVHTVAFQK